MAPSASAVIGGVISLEQIGGHYRLLRLPIPSDGESRGSGRTSTRSSQGRFLGRLDLGDLSLGEQEHPCGFIDLGVAAAQPFQRHHGVLDLFVSVVEQHRPQGLFLGGVGALLVPVDRLKLLDQRFDGAVKVLGRLGQEVGRLVVTLVAHAWEYSRVSARDQWTSSVG